MRRSLIVLAALVVMIAGAFSLVQAQEAATCSDTIDNDNDGLIDFPNDPGCSNANDNTETKSLAAGGTECDDNLDNDGDGAVDVAGGTTGMPGDPDCESPTDTSESGDGNGEHPPVAADCFAIADEAPGTDDDDDGDAIEDLLTAVNPEDPDPATNETTVGSTGTNSVESLAFQPGTGTLFGVDADQLGTFDLGTAAFTPTAATLGSGPGAVGVRTFDNVDGLAFDSSGTLYGVERRGSDADLLIVIDPATGAHVANAFGAGVDYVEIDPVAGLTDIDDIAIAGDGTMYAIANEEGQDDRLIRVDPATGDTTDVGPTGIEDVEGLTFAPDGGLLGTVGSAGDALVDIDTATGTASNPRTLDNGQDYEGIACRPGHDDGNNVTGTKFHDSEPIGQFDEHDGRIGDVEIHLFNEDGSVHLHTTTAEDGTYGFDVEPGTYTICETQVEGLSQTYPTEGADCTGHEVGEGQSIGPVGYEVTIAEEEGSRSDNNDFGNGGGGNGACPEVREDCNVIGVKWHDMNGDAVIDEGEALLANWEIVLFGEEGTDPLSVFTASDGFYGFKVDPGTYTVCEVLQEGWTQTAPMEGADCAALDPDDTLGLADFGYEVTIVADEVSENNDFGNNDSRHCAGTANGGHTDGLLLPDTIGWSLWNGGLQIPPVTEDPQHNGILSQPLADLEGSLLGTEELGCLVDLLVDESLGLDP